MNLAVLLAIRLLIIYQCCDQCYCCEAGYIENGVNCEDIDECTLANGECEQICTNTQGSFSCSCTNGDTLDDEDNHTCLTFETSTAESISPEKKVTIPLFRRLTTTGKSGLSLKEKIGLALGVFICVFGALILGAVVYWLKFHKPEKAETLEITHSVEEEREIHEILFDKDAKKFNKPKLVAIQTKPKTLDQVVLDVVNKNREKKCLKPLKINKKPPQRSKSLDRNSNKRGSIKSTKSKK